MGRDWPDAVDFTDPRAWPDVRVARYVPRDNRDLDAYDELYRQCFHRPQTWILCDEAGLVFPSTGAAPYWALRVLQQGRKYELGHAACHTRPLEVDKNLLAQARHVLLWHLPQASDRKYVADNIGLDRATLEGLLETPPTFVHFDALAYTLQVIDPPPV